MAKKLTRARPKELQIHPLTSNRWNDLEQLFGKRGACGGCWCMFWRLPHSQWVRQKGAANRRSFKKVVESGEAPGVIAYLNGQPAGWCAFAPRERYPRFQKSRVLKPIDENPVWAITCFFVARPFRRHGVTLALLEAAAKYAAAHGARIMEGYPIDPKPGYPDVFYYTGLVSTFRRARFKEVARRSPTRPIMRRHFKEPK